MRVLLALLLLGCIASVGSAITGVQSFYWSSHNGAVDSSVTYWQGPWRWLALVSAAMFAVAFYGVYRRYPLAWKIGFVLVWLSAVQFVFEAWRMLLPEDQGWVGATVVTLFTPFVAVYWANWWRRQKSWFLADADQT